MKLLYALTVKCWNVSFKDQYCFEVTKAKSISVPYFTLVTLLDSSVSESVTMNTDCSEIVSR